MKWEPFDSAAYEEWCDFCGGPIQAGYIDDTGVFVCCEECMAARPAGTGSGEVKRTYTNNVGQAVFMTARLADIAQSGPKSTMKWEYFDGSAYDEWCDFCSKGPISSGYLGDQPLQPLVCCEECAAFVIGDNYDTSLIEGVQQANGGK